VNRSADDATDPPTGYIRGGGGLPSSSRHVLRVFLAVCSAFLAALTVALIIGAAHENSRNHELQRHGVPVEVTVTSCLGTATGTGITVNGFTCHGSFVLNGQRYDDVIGGSSQLLARGSVLKGVADPQSPAVLSAAQAVRTSTASWRPFIRPAIPLAVLIAVAGFVLWRRRARSRNPGAQSTRSEDDGCSDTDKAGAAP